VKSKLPGTHQARDLYISPLFRSRKSHVERTSTLWFVLSAKYGLLKPTDEVETYDVVLSDLTRAERCQWSNRIVGDLKSRVGSLDRKKIEIHAGMVYRNNGLSSGLANQGAEVNCPVQDLGIGEQLAWYARRSGMS